MTRGDNSSNMTSHSSHAHIHEAIQSTRSSGIRHRAADFAKPLRAKSSSVDYDVTTSTKRVPMVCCGLLLLSLCRLLGLGKLGIGSAL